MKTMNRLVPILVVSALTLVSGIVFAQSKPDRFYLPQPDQPFVGTVDTRIGTLEFKNQYPSKQSLDCRYFWSYFYCYLDNRSF